MEGMEIIARTISVPTVRDRLGKRWQYHPRSDRHSKVAWAILFDLLQSSHLLQEHVAVGKVTFSINRQLNDWETGKKKDLDLVVARTTGPGGAAASKAFSLPALAEQYGILLTGDERATLEKLPMVRPGTAGATVLVALEAKACMTAHVRARPRIYDELTSSHSTIHGDNAHAHALAIGFVMINLADEYVSPDLNRLTMGIGRPVVISKHRQPHDTERMIEKIKEIRRRSGPMSGKAGFDAMGIMVVDMLNDGLRPVTLVTDPPAPSPTSEFHYDQMIGRAAHLYDTNFGNV
jgi:hypothetical protein